MGNLKSDTKLAMGYTVSDYDYALKSLFNNSPYATEDGTSPGTYTETLTSLMDEGFNTSSLNLNERGFTIGDDEDQKIVALKFLPKNGFVAAKKSEDKYTMIETKYNTGECFYIYGISVRGKYTTPPYFLQKDLIEASKNNGINGEYRLGCSINVDVMLRNYFIHFYQNENIGKGLKDNTISHKLLLKIIEKECLFAEVSFPNFNKTKCFMVTDAYDSLSIKENYFYIDSPVCVSSAYNDIFECNLDTSEYEPVNSSSSYEYKTGKLDSCNSSNYMEYVEKKYAAFVRVDIKLKNDGYVGVRFFCLKDKRKEVEKILGPMPDDFFKDASEFPANMGKVEQYSGVEFVKGEISKARETFCEERGPVPDSTLNKLKNCYSNFISKRNDPLFNKEYKKSGQDAWVGTDCGYFYIPSGYPIALGSRFFDRHQIITELTTRPLSSLKDERMLDWRVNGASSNFLRGYEDSIYEDLYNKAKGHVAIKCNKYIGDLWTALFQAILDYYGGKNLPKIAPSLCVLTCGIRTKDDAPQAGICHRTGKAFDLDYYNNWGTRGGQTFDKGRNTNYKAFLEMIRASGSPWPISSGGKPDWMHFQWK